MKIDERYLGYAAQAWCSEGTGHIEMDVNLCTEFARLMQLRFNQLETDNEMLRNEIDILKSDCNVGDAEFNEKYRDLPTI